MATKTFKIGLSATDKQNMAQDVYERLLALTFPEYDSDKTYNKGDFVVYNDVLYKCIADTTTGTWDSGDWQQATLNDLLTDIESAVAFVNDKANVDGNYPTMTVGVADQLSPYDDESGDDQDEPFSFQATGTGNGSQPDFATGAIALMKEKQGNTVVVNQLVNPNNLIATQTVHDVVFTNNGNGTLTINGTASAMVDKNVISNIPVIGGHKYLLFSNLQGSSDSLSNGFTIYAYGSVVGTFVGNYIIGTANNNGNLSIYFLIQQTVSINQTIGFYLIDLTQWFNGDIPQDLLDNPSNFYRYYQGSLAYNEGELVNSNGRYLKAIGRNQFDKDTVVSNKYITNDGTVIDDNTGVGISCSDYIKVVPNDIIFLKNTGAGNYMNIIYGYDKDKNILAIIPNYNDDIHLRQIPSNCVYVRINVVNAEIDTQVLSIYYDDESGYDKYYPYELLTNNDTGTEVLRSAGSVKDYKTHDGVVHRLVGTQDLSQLSWTMYDTNKFSASISGLGMKVPSGSAITPNMIHKDLIAVSSNTTLSPSSKQMTVVGSTIYVANSSWSSTSDINGTLNYELAEPTTEQGTPYSENIVIDDFGSMDFSGTSGVPQGNLIFYPVDYKAFIDTLYDYTEGTPSNIALKSDLSADKTELQGVDTQLQNAIGGTLRHCLAIQESGLDFEDTDFVDLGTLTWTEFNTNVYVCYPPSIVSFSNDSQASNKIMCSKYKIVARDYASANTNNAISQKSNYVIFYSTTMNANQIKELMKGVLLAYEKASA